MFKKLSVKTKFYILGAVSIIAICLLVMVGINNREEIKAKNSVKKNVENIEKLQAAQKKEEEQQKLKEEKDKEEKKKALEEKFQKGQDTFNNKQYLEAITIEEEVLKEDPLFYKAYAVKGIALCYSGKYDDGMADIDKCLELKSDFGYGRFNKALAYELYGHYEDALEWYDKALAVENYVWSHYGKASIYGRRGDVENTVKNLKIAVEMNPAVKGVAREEPDFNPVKESSEFQSLVRE